MRDPTQANIGNGLWDGAQGNSPLQQFVFLVNWVRRHLRDSPQPPAPIVACETGFNWGVSALAFLCAAPEVTVQSFDLPSGWPGSGPADKPYIHVAREWLLQHFPNRFNLTFGDSLHTVPAHGARIREGRTRMCDLTFVDGGHTFGHAYADMRSLRCAAKPQSLMLADDCAFLKGDAKPGVRNAYRSMVDEGRLHHVADVDFGGHHGCLAQYHEGS